MIVRLLEMIEAALLRWAVPFVAVCCAFLLVRPLG